MTPTQKAHMAAMRESGASYQEIAEMFGISRQRVCHLLMAQGGTGTREVNRLNHYVFPNLAAWMNRNKITLATLGELTGKENTCVLNILKGKVPPKLPFILKVLEITGMTFEEAFATKERKP